MKYALKPYPDYKDSSVPWLGEVPAHWEVKPLKHWAHINAKVLPENTDPDCDIEYLEIGSVSTGFLVAKPQRIRFGDAPSRARRLLRRGDTIISTVRTYLKAVYFVSVQVENLVASTGFAALTPSSAVEPECLSYVVQSEPFINRVCAESVGTAYPAIAESRLGSFAVALPPLPEQCAIARFLDHHDRLTRRYIRAQRRLIELLTEQKQALIQQSVTRGLDPYVKLKPSGVEWLGEIPEHWDERPAKYFFREVDERSQSGEEELLSVSHITGVTPRSQKNVTMFKAESYAGYKLCRANDLVINTMWAWMGALGVAKQAGIVSSSYAVYRPINSEAFVSEYVDHLLRAKPYVSEYICRSTGIRSSRLRVYPEQFLKIPLICPPYEEQEKIAAFVKGETQQLDQTIIRAQRQIDLIREYRTRLVADMVTGKLDVRGVSLPDLDEAGDMGDLDELEEDAELDNLDVEEMNDAE
jgi:type I restriction enzyme S subunit